MEETIKKEKFRKLSIASFVTGIISLTSGILYSFLWYYFTMLLIRFFGTETVPSIIAVLIFFFIALSIVAVVCGYVDLIKIKSATGNKGRGLDIAGIIMGFLFIILIFLMMSGEMLATL